MGLVFLLFFFLFVSKNWNILREKEQPNLFCRYRYTSKTSPCGWLHPASALLSCEVTPGKGATTISFSMILSLLTTHWSARDLSHECRLQYYAVCHWVKGPVQVDITEFRTDVVESEFLIAGANSLQLLAQLLAMIFFYTSARIAIGFHYNCVPVIYILWLYTHQCNS